jgi:lipid II isoglutaminyl synthase (glutamine-hydrolysing)
MSASALRVAVVYPDLLGTYGDGGNGLIVARRAAWRGLPVELLQATSDRPLPTADVYCLGGGEDGPQVLAAERLRADGTLASAVEAGAAVLAVCAGYQIVGRSFPAADGQEVPGVGLLDMTTVKSSGPRAVGELLAQPVDSALGIGELTGFENHAGHTRLGPGATALASVVTGTGNGDGTEGARAGRVIGTYCHGPVLARNPALADRLITWATGEVPAALDDRAEQALREERLAAARRRNFGRLRRLRAGRH